MAKNYLHFTGQLAIANGLNTIIAPAICLPTIAWLRKIQPSAAANTGCSSKSYFNSQNKGLNDARIENRVHDPGYVQCCSVKQCLENNMIHPDYACNTLDNCKETKKECIKERDEAIKNKNYNKLKNLEKLYETGCP